MAWGLRAVRGCIGRRLSKSSPVFAPLSRAVRLTRLLQARMLKVLKDLEAGLVPKLGTATRRAAHWTRRRPVAKVPKTPRLRRRARSRDPRPVRRVQQGAFDRTGGVSYRGDLRTKPVEAARSKAGRCVSTGAAGTTSPCPSNQPYPSSGYSPPAGRRRHRHDRVTSETAFTEHPAPASTHGWSAAIPARPARHKSETCCSSPVRHHALLALDWSLWKDRTTRVKPLVRRRDALPPPARALE